MVPAGPAGLSIPLNRTTTIASLACVLALAVAAGADVSPPREAAPPRQASDALAAEIARWSGFLKDNTSTDAIWTEVKRTATPALERAASALRDGRRLLALQRLAAVRVNLSASAWLQARPRDARQSDAGFEAERGRLGRALGDSLAPPSPDALEGVRPAAVRALGEAALAQVRVYYDASLEYGRNTMPDDGLFYLGAAQAQKEFAGFCRSVEFPAAGRAPRLRSLTGEIDSLEHDLLALYRPPVSIDRHREFITASATLNEARELDAAGLRYGALLRYLEAALRAAPLRPAPPAAGVVSALQPRLRDFETRLRDRAVDSSLGRMFLESAQADLAAPPADTGPAVARAIVTDVLPRYFAALEPARGTPPRPAPEVTVTLVRWPYT